VVPVARELFTVYGSASPTASGESGDFALTSPLVRGSFSYIRVPKGMRLKVWAKRLGGTAGFTLLVQYTPDVTVPSPTWTALDAEHLASAGSLELEKRRPAVVYGFTGKEAVKLSYANATGAGTIYAAAEVEVSDEGE
jgi:hypothetical protein